MAKRRRGLSIRENGGVALAVLGNARPLDRLYAPNENRQKYVDLSDLNTIREQGVQKVTFVGCPENLHTIFLNEIFSDSCKCKYGCSCGFCRGSFSRHRSVKKEDNVKFFAIIFCDFFFVFIFCILQSSFYSHFFLFFHLFWAKVVNNT